MTTATAKVIDANLVELTGTVRDVEPIGLHDKLLVVVEVSQPDNPPDDVLRVRAIIGHPTSWDLNKDLWIGDRVQVEGRIANHGHGMFVAATRISKLPREDGGDIEIPF